MTLINIELSLLCPICETTPIIVCDEQKVHVQCYRGHTWEPRKPWCAVCFAKGEHTSLDQCRQFALNITKRLRQRMISEANDGLFSKEFADKVLNYFNELDDLKE